ncbi:MULTISPECIES: hypothetical protein [unclassified Burkholderia]|uniref:hypothetical protein n=1 Tax=unclassified Burkholderia TaxID=2613784 RepID=UPI001E303EE0|nr:MULTISPECIES: hypothetical protein [unclassified Burkholderia]UEP27471.1 hypothetical protein LMA01_14370 [Burkholderia sp. B21-007]UEP40990.1 hypothetical protein LMA02_14295 [Burkholderia sp. B21-005]
MLQRLAPKRFFTFLQQHAPSDPQYLPRHHFRYWKKGAHENRTTIRVIVFLRIYSEIVTRIISEIGIGIGIINNELNYRMNCRT